MNVSGNAKMVMRDMHAQMLPEGLIRTRRLSIQHRSAPSQQAGVDGENHLY